MKARAVVTAIGAATAGLIIGALLTAWFMSRFLTSALAGGAVATVAVDGRALEYLHDGTPDAATGLLQSRLDGELLTIGWNVKDGYVLTPDAKKALLRVKRLRDVSGYEPADPAVRDAVREALAFAAPAK